MSACARRGGEGFGGWAAAARNGGRARARRRRPRGCRVRGGNAPCPSTGAASRRWATARACWRTCRWRPARSPARPARRARCPTRAARSGEQGRRGGTVDEGVGAGAAAGSNGEASTGRRAGRTCKWRQTETQTFSPSVFLPSRQRSKSVDRMMRQSEAKTAIDAAGMALTHVDAAKGGDKMRGGGHEVDGARQAGRRVLAWRSGSPRQPAQQGGGLSQEAEYCTT